MDIFTNIRGTLVAPNHITHITNQPNVSGNKITTINFVGGGYVDIVGVSMGEIATCLATFNKGRRSFESSQAYKQPPHPYEY